MYFYNGGDRNHIEFLVPKLWGGRLFESGHLLEGGSLFEGGAYIIASIIHEIQKFNMQEFCYILLFTSTFYAQITTKLSIAYLIYIICCWYEFVC